MVKSKLSESGQTTIPASVRKYLGVSGGDVVQYSFENGRVFIEPARSSIQDLKGILPKPDHETTLEEMDDAIADAAAETLD